MSEHHLTLMEFIKKLLGDDSESIQLRDWFEQNPHAALEHYGLGHLSPEDVDDAMVLVQDNDTVSFDRNYDTGSNWLGTAAAKPASEWHRSDDHGDDGGHGRHGEGHHDPVVREHVTNNHITNKIDDRDTIVDNSVNQNIDTGGGDLRQNFDNHSVTASGDGAVAARGDIEDSTVTTGDDNVVGNGNHVVHGDGNTTAFGSGSATKVGDVGADDGGAVSFGGNATGNQTTSGSFNDSHDSSEVDTTIEDSYNPDSSQDNDTDDHSHNDVGSHNSTDFHVG